MRLFLLGAPCAGKTTLIGPLRRLLDGPVLDMDEELVRVNQGAWPPLDRKRAQTLQLMNEWSSAEHVVLAYSILDEEGLELLRQHRWRLALLDLPEAVIRARSAQRERQEGWTNIQWLPLHLDNLAWLRSRQAFDHVVDATRPVSEVAEAVASLTCR